MTEKVYPYTSAPKTSSLTEVIPLKKGKGYKYIRKEKLNGNVYKKVSVNKSITHDRIVERRKGWYNPDTKKMESSKKCESWRERKDKIFKHHKKAFDYNKFKEQVKDKLNPKKTSSLKFDTGNLLMHLDMYNDIQKFCKKYNKKILDAKSEGEIYDASAEAQLFRFAANASANGKISFPEGKITLEGQIDASFALGEGRARARLFYPDKKGCHWELTTKSGKKFDLGFFYTRVVLQLYGFAGASACLSASLVVDKGEFKGDPLDISKELESLSRKKSQKKKARIERKIEKKKKKKQEEIDKHNSNEYLLKQMLLLV
ncbi:hypothetical protein [Zooshikella harenae]|uniref:Uncharacterized protein n=1 Tax=Zooshikella harenae TaxID=2827238 RepID=A0ABS5ZLG6_9GAMM|nr:hypothetical protein [Zooshikella harenae]MBU2713997.1 hypothetical protein [Zooshikella harenae]